MEALEAGRELAALELERERLALESSWTAEERAAGRVWAITAVEEREEGVREARVQLGDERAAQLRAEELLIRAELATARARARRCV